MSPLSAITLMGPTASGKTALAIELVEAGLPLEIISVDSALIYRGMDIGTAKPTATELSRAPHHLIDIRNPTEHYSAGEFIEDVNVLIENIRARGKIPFLVGGTMLYFKALQQGMALLPKQNPALRAEIEHEAAQQGWPALHAELMRIDPVAAQKIKPTDAQRIQRALEVFRLTGEPLSSLQAKADHPKRVPIQAFAIIPEDRATLHQRIAERVSIMLQKGFIEEVIKLREQYPLNPHLPSMRAVGYRQIWQYLEGEMSQDELPERILFATRQYAKRQLTWLKRWENVSKFDLTDLAKLKNAINMLTFD